MQEPIGGAGVPKEAESKALTLWNRAGQGQKPGGAAEVRKGRDVGRAFMVGGEGS